MSELDSLRPSGEEPKEGEVTLVRVRVRARARVRVRVRVRARVRVRVRVRARARARARVRASPTPSCSARRCSPTRTLRLWDTRRAAVAAAQERSYFV